MKYMLLVLLFAALCLPLRAAVFVPVPIPEAAVKRVSFADTTSGHQVERPNYLRGKKRIVAGILVAALGAIFYNSATTILVAGGTGMLVVGGLFVLAGVLSLIDQSVRYKQRRRKAKVDDNNS